MTKYMEISTAIRQKIVEGKYPPGGKLPQEKVLGEAYGASKMTIKKAIDLLVAEGLVIKRSGSGTFVKSLSQPEIQRIHNLSQFKGATTLYADEDVTSKVLSFEVMECPRLMAQKLNIAPGDKVWKVYRVRFLEDVPFVMEKTYMPVEVIKGLQLAHLHGSLYGYIEKGLGLSIETFHRTLTVRNATLLEASEMDLQERAAVAVGEQVAYLSNGVAFEYSISVHKSELFSFSTVVSR
ncbi:MAG: GntR family transcriptional regulator [Turicibacter sp.]|nr:GntR family transcriptional regulator [Turicibacter sp.]